jgi:hypothetical protein
MKVVEDKVTVYPPHAICKADIPVVLSTLPTEWTAEIKTVRLCSSHGENPQLIAWFFPSTGLLNVKSRGISKERTLQAILIELSGHALGVKFLNFRRLQKRDEARVHRLIAPLVKEILPQLSQKKVWLDK